MVLGSGLLLLPLAWLLRINLKTFLPPMMFNNSGNMGIPLILFAFGESALQAAVVLFIIEMVLHFTIRFYILNHRTTRYALLLVFAALPPAVLNVLVAEQYQQEPDRVASIVLLGNLASLVIMPVVLWFALPH